MKEKVSFVSSARWACKAAGKTENKKYHPRETFVSSQKKSIIATFLRPKKEKRKKKKEKKEG
jgi:hypothetical protein